MKKLVILVVMLIFPLSMLFAHSASEIKTDYDSKTKILTVHIKHSVSTSKNTNTKQHFIKEVKVEVNGVEQERKTMTSQNGDEVMLTAKIQAKPGDVITVTSTCSLPATTVAETTVK